MNKTFVVLAVVLGLYGIVETNPNLLQPTAQRRPASDQVITDAFNQQQSDVQLGGSGVVVHILPDDTRGSRHQKFLLKLQSGQKLLISHNIDLAPRIDSLRRDDTVEFYGVYEWNAKGGLVHWTHHDPAGRHEDGWLRHNETLYQ